MFLFYPIIKNLRNKTIFKTYKNLTYAMLQITKPLQNKNPYICYVTNYKTLTKKEYYYLNHIYKTLTYAMLQITKPYKTIFNT